jgi:anti-sigma factor RsiW
VSRCLDSERLLALSMADPIEERDDRYHLRACPACSAAYHEIIGQNAIIVRALQSTAEAIMIAPSAKAPSRQAPIAHARRANRPSVISVNGIAAGFTAAMAAALLLMLTSVPPTAKLSESSLPSAKIDLPNSAADQSSAPARITSNGGFPYMSWQSDQNELILTEPTDQIGYQEAIAGESQYQDLLYCERRDDGIFCSMPGEPG